MKLIIGFGDTEKRLEDRLEAAIRKHVVEQYGSRPDYYFTDDFVEEIRQWVQGLAVDSQEQADAYRDATEYPDRYSRFWATTIADASHIVFILKFHHINRRHAFSPDGWAMLESERVFYVKHYEVAVAGKEAV